MLIRAETSIIRVMFNPQNSYSWPKAGTKQLGFRFSPGCYADLEILVSEYGLTMTDAFERLVYFVSHEDISPLAFRAIMGMSKSEFFSLSVS